VPYEHFTKNDRVQLSGFLRAGLSNAEIGRLLGKHRSSIARELSRNKTENKFRYDAGVAQRQTKGRRILANQRFRKIENNSWLRDYVEASLEEYWSPEQVAGRMLIDIGKRMVCHETIYQYIYKRNPALKRYLRCQKGKYRRRYGTLQRPVHELFSKRRIDSRPEIINNRGRVGDFEGDTIEGKDNSGHILSLVDRKSGYLLAAKLERAQKALVKEAALRKLASIPKNKKFTLTFDNGSEFDDYDLIEKATGMTVYFSNPYHYWERGTNENTNGLIRQFFPKRSSFKKVSQIRINQCADLINKRPRKRLNFFTPQEVFVESCTLD